MDNLALEVNERRELVDEYDGDPESDSFLFIKTILKSLQTIDALADALKVMSDRLGVEIQSIIIRCANDAKHRYISTLLT